ncbi:hypothetical protein Ddye_012008 [Dipteronia dyeriana]|uniref:Glutaredoxin domain-containing protein n=1 Tax=Dipteronia dyeriana TaxID=168575 RepID=A0AAE0CI24_9ROSI|nr:hypothetical protein Ddye_012008 [Dipteronia dyeriana]
MGCSASRPNTLLTKGHHNQYNQEEPSSSSTTTCSSLESTMFSSSSSPKPIPRALSLPTPLVHHPPSRKGDTHHLVSLTSTTYGSLLLIDPQVPTFNGQDRPPSTQKQPNLIKKTQQQISSNPVETLSPDSVINTWELMDGLDDDFDYQLVDKPADSPSITKPLWKHLSEESLLSKMDPNVASSYRRALSSRQFGYKPEVVKNVSSPSPVSSPVTCSLSSSNHQHLVSGTKNQIVIYFTSLRGIRKTYEDCCSVRMIFKGFRVQVDERDISMDSMYRKELQSLLGGKAMSLPQVFIGGNHIGGAEDIKQMNEAGDLAKILEDFPVGDPLFVCESCGDARFIPCPNCCGSKKVFDEIEEQLRRCPNCNENGLIRCPACLC